MPIQLVPKGYGSKWSCLVVALLVNIKIKVCYLFYFLIRLKKHANLNRTWEDYSFS